ncbi:SulP family inorganic anion transporter [Comamonas flocculans]|uniref:SulP family inorganic anion transporter n=1 Tax=Comamonas flocculans TaxID=2597701 RepID=A0A5B8RX89_9BURK|nr:SulP family inorganic anion transporter [Comamonas flocculans]QEA14206.1 SulP family inorganic anion transporter [Comamonas flocculans]
MSIPRTLSSWLPFLAWPRPSRELLRGEFWAGMTVGLMLVPQGVAYAQLAGMPLVTGMYASLIPMLVAVLWGSSVRLGVGPTALTSLLTGTSLIGLAQPGSAHWVTLAVWLALLSGLLQALLGVVRFGWLLSLVTSPILNGFTQAAALLILMSQLPALLGLTTPWRAFLHDPSWQALDGHAAAFGLGSLALLWLAARWRRSFPAAIVVIALTATLSWATGFADAGGKVVGALPQGLPAPYLPGWLSWDEFSTLVMPVMVITLVSFLETASSAKVDHREGGTQWNENQDLIAHGLAKVSSGLCGAFAVSASFSRSALNLYAGARTGWATLFAFALVLAALLWLLPLLYHVPQSVLAAIVIVAIKGLIQPRGMLSLWRVSRVETATGLLTFAITLLSAPRIYWGVLTGLLVNLSHFIYQRLHPRIIEVGLHPDGTLRDRALWGLGALDEAVLALRMDAALDFASATALEKRVADAFSARPALKHLCLFAQPINRIDVTGVEAFMRLLLFVQGHGGTLYLSGLKLPVQQTLQAAGALEPGPHLLLCRSDGETLQRLGHDPAN